MEYFKSNNKNNKLYNKINWIKLLIVFVVSFIIFSLFFYYIGNSKDIDSTIINSIIISILLAIWSILNDILQNRTRIFVCNEKEIGYIEIHEEKTGKFLRDYEFQELIDKTDIKDIYSNNHLYEGIDKGIIKNIVKIKKKYNRTVLEANVIEKSWKSASRVSITKLYLVDKEYKKKFIIPNDYDNYEKLYKKLSKLN